MKNIIAACNSAHNVLITPINRETLNKGKNLLKQWVKQEFTQIFAPSEEQLYVQSRSILKAAYLGGCLAMFSLSLPTIMLLQLYSLFKLMVFTYHLCQEDIDKFAEDFLEKLYQQFY